MSRPGTPWTVRNIGRSIQFGGVHPTVMVPEGTVIYDPYTSPWQCYSDRRVFLSPLKSKTLSGKFAGGESKVAPGGGGTRNLSGGSWYNPSFECISWTDRTIYIKGKFKELLFVPYLLQYGSILACSLHAPAVANSFLPSPQPFKHTALIIYHEYTTVTNDYSPKYAVCGINYGIGAELSYQVVSSGVLDFPSLTINSSNPNLPKVTGFDDQGLRFGALLPIEATSVTPLRATIYLTVFSSDLHSHSTTMIMDEVVDQFYTSYSDDGVYGEYLDSSSESTLYPGIPFVRSIRMEHDHLTLLGINYISASENSVTNWDNSPWTKSGSRTFSYSQEVVVSKLSFGGTVNTWNTQVFLNGSETFSFSQQQVPRYHELNRLVTQNTIGVYYFSFDERALLFSLMEYSHEASEIGELITDLGVSVNTSTGYQTDFTLLVDTGGSLSSARVEDILHHSEDFSSSSYLKTVDMENPGSNPDSTYYERLFGANDTTTFLDACVSTDKLLMAMVSLYVPFKSTAFTLILDKKSLSHSLNVGRLDRYPGVVYQSQLGLINL